MEKLNRIFCGLFSHSSQNDRETEYTEEVDIFDYYRRFLTDRPRNKAFKHAALENMDQIREKVVLVIDAGPGLFSMFFASAGAKTIYAVEVSELYKIAEAVAEANMASNIIKVINKDISEITAKDVSGKVDIIVCDWMGCYLFEDTTLNSVLFARDKFLKTDGLIFPESAALYSAACRVPSMYEFWDDIEGYNMKIFGDKLRKKSLENPLFETVDPDNLLSCPECVISMDLRKITCAEIRNIKTQLIAVANKEGWCQGICLWFTATFPSSGTEPVILSTAPEEMETLWRQTTILLPIQMDVAKGTPIAYEVSLERDEENETYNIDVTMLDPAEIEHPENCFCNMPKCALARETLT